MNAATMTTQQRPGRRADLSGAAHASLPVAVHATVIGLDGSGGDVLDVRRAGRSQMGVTVGDVTGHGAEASPHADAVREVLANMDEVDRNSPDWLDSLNARLTEQLDDDHFCAAISVRLDRSNSSDTLEANIAVAGMPAPMIVRKSGQIEWLQGGSLPLGVEDEALFVPDTATCLLHAGDKLVIFSDGVSEAHADDRELFGIHRVERVSSSLSAASGSEIIKGLLAAVRNHMSGQTPLDDMTVAVIENIASEQQTGRQAA